MNKLVCVVTTRSRSMLMGMLALISALSLLVPRRALADTTQQGFDLDRFDPAERNGRWFVLDPLDFRGDTRPFVGLTLDYAYKPLVVYNDDGTENTDIVRDQLYIHLGGGVTLFSRLRIAADVKAAAINDGNTATVNGIVYPAASGFAFGDPRVGVDVRILGETTDPVTLAAGAQVYIPIGNRAQWAGDGSIRLSPHVLVAGQLSFGEAGDFVYAGKAAFTYRGNTEQVGTLTLGSDVSIAGAAGMALLDDRALTVGVEVYGGTEVIGSGVLFASETTPFEGLGSAHYRIGDFVFGFGIGPGFTRALGTPTIRGLFAFDYNPVPPKPVADRDHDGIPDDKDACPDQPGPASADPTKNGCPPPADRDHDGVTDDKDACPDVPGIATNDPTTNGCPDKDGDGIPDDKDACPEQKGPKTNDPKTNGCPPDRDHDGIPDDKDACPDTPGVPSLDPKLNGCPPPPPDRDHDGIPDDKDACPDKPGPANADPTMNGCPDTDGDGLTDNVDNCPTEAGPKENGGCPLKKKQLVIITKKKIEIKDKVYFDFAKATIQKRSFKLLDNVADVLNSHPDIEKIRVEGHTDNVGSAETNRKLSQARAESVRTYLVKKGVDEKRLDAHGYGPDRPVDTNKTNAGRANNRRVEFVIEGAESDSTQTQPEGGSTTPEIAPDKGAKSTDTVAPKDKDKGAKDDGAKDTQDKGAKGKGSKDKNSKDKGSKDKGSKSSDSDQTKPKKNPLLIPELMPNGGNKDDKKTSP